MAEEIELKLAAPADVLAAVRKHPAVAAVARGRPRTTRLTTTYYDTPQRDLAAAGVALRLRHANGRWLQTVKGAGGAAAGVHRRAEYEWRVDAPRLDRTKLARTPWRKLFAARTGYRRVFATDIRRSEQPLAFADGTRATLCLDVGEIRAGRRRVPLSEIEVELKAGDPSRLFELASTLAADLPVRIEHQSKAARGYALAGQVPPGPRHAKALMLAPDAAAPSALQTLGHECLAQMEANAAALGDPDPEYLHQLRVGWRRLRALLKLAAPLASPETIAALDEELDWLGSELGPARDYDVFALETLAKVAAEFRGERGIARLRRRAAAHRRKAGRGARQAIANPRTQKLFIALGAWLAAPTPGSAPSQAPTSARDWARTSLEKGHAKLRKRAKHAHRLDAAERHRARVAAKRQRYAAEFFASLFSGKRVDGYVQALSRVQSALGRLNDLQVAGTLVDVVAPRGDTDAQTAHAGGVVRGWLAASTAAELKRLREVQRAFRRCPAFWNP